jgi:hypothetical protein
MIDPEIEEFIRKSIKELLERELSFLSKKITDTPQEKFDIANKNYVDTLGGLNLSQGDIFYYDGTKINRLAAGTSGHFLKTQGSGANPIWSSIGGVVGKFGGTGEDGALEVSSGILTIDLGGVKKFVRNYTSISITGTGAINFINPHSGGTLIILKSQGNVTLTSTAVPMIDCRGLGGRGGAGGISSFSSINGQDGVSGNFILDLLPHFGSGGLAGNTSGAGGGAGGNDFSEPRNIYINEIFRKFIVLACGSGGGGGSAAYGTAPGMTAGGKGGNGGGALYIECGGAWNFTTVEGIDVSGEDGQNGVDITINDSSSTGGGGGGGSAGMFLAIVNSITANTGTIRNVAGKGGRGGNITIPISPGSPFTTFSGAGGGGGAFLGAGGTGGNRRISNNDGFTGGDGGSGAGGGGGGGAARSIAGTANGGLGGAGGVGIEGLVLLNTEFV